MCVGGWMSFSSVAIPKMMNGTIPGDPIQIDLHVGSWIASTFFIGNVVGCLVGGLINQVAKAREWTVLRIIGRFSERGRLSSSALQLLLSPGF